MTTDDSGPVPPWLRAVWPRAAILATTAAILFTGLITLRRFPNSADEYSYMVSAELFARGTLSVPSPEPREFFDFIHVVNNGRYFGKYPPGWPAILCVGVLAGVPSLVAPLLGVGVLVLLYRLALENFSREEADLTLLVAFCNPFLVFNAASFFSHLPCLFFVTLTLYLGFRLLRNPEPASVWAALGAAGGAAFLIRPYTAVAFLLPLAAFLGLRVAPGLPRRQRLRNLAAAAGPAVAAVGALMLYNVALGGGAITGPYGQFDTMYRLGRQPGSEDWAWGFRYNLLERMADLTAWIPCSGILLALMWFRRDQREDPRRVLLILMFVSLLGAQFIFLRHPGNQYGPRYVLEAWSVVVLLMAGALRSWKKAGAIAAALVLVGNLTMFVLQTRYFSGQVRERTEVYEAVRRAGLSKAIVFLDTGSGGMPPGDLTRNGVDFKGEVLYVHHRGLNNWELKARYPGRKSFVFRYDPETKSGSLTPD
jgi:4-amino-4-deoxy-L-arabinose transferase-like glycosyltransferase